jgi:membrane-bound serine protease (ClpP class)
MKLRKKIRQTSGLLAVAVWLLITVAGQSQANSSVLLMNAEGPLTPAMLNYVERGIATAQQQGSVALIIQLNTPGGEIDLMDKICNRLLESRVPVVVYVAPPGAIAGSAGTLVTLAAHANAMAPQTAIGAASPVGSQGEDIGETMSAKVKSVLKAQVRNMAARRPPQAIALAESAIDEARAATAEEAKAAGLTDFIASDVPDLIRQLDGYTVTVNGRAAVLRTTGVTVTPLPMNVLEELLNLLTNPNIIFVLLALGAQLILIELSSPGGWVAGFVGLVCLALAFYGLGVLPVNWFGIAFIILAFVLFVIDANAPTHGLLTVAATGSLIAGALVLFNSPGASPFSRVSVPLVVGTSVGLGALFFAFLLYALRARRLPITTMNTTLVGRTGEVREALDPAGTVQIAGELWSAQAGGEHIETGARVEVIEVNGLTLRVRRI